MFFFLFLVSRHPLLVGSSPLPLVGWEVSPLAPFMVGRSPFAFLVGRSSLPLLGLGVSLPPSPFWLDGLSPCWLGGLPVLLGCLPLPLLVGGPPLSPPRSLAPPPCWGSPPPLVVWAVSDPLWVEGGWHPLPLSLSGWRSSPPFLDSLFLGCVVSPPFWLAVSPFCSRVSLLVGSSPLSLLVGQSLFSSFWLDGLSAPFLVGPLPCWLARTPPRSLGPTPPPLLFGGPPLPGCLGRLPSLLGWLPFWVGRSSLRLVCWKEKNKEKKKRKKEKRKKGEKKKKKKNKKEKKEKTQRNKEENMETRRKKQEKKKRAIIKARRSCEL